MTLTREDPQVLRAGLPPAWFALGCGLATTLGTIWGLRTYGTDLLHAAHELLPEAPLAELRTPLALLFTALPGLWTLVRAVGLATVPGKLRAARTWENRLRDPSTSAQVPPLAGHLISAQRLTTAKAAWHTVALGLATGPCCCSPWRPSAARCPSKTSAAGWALDSRCSPCWSAPCGCSRFDSCV